MWVAREENGLLRLYTKKPYRYVGGIWRIPNDGDCITISDEEYPQWKSIKWEDKPIEVKFEKVFKLKAITFLEEQIKRLQDAADKISEMNVSEEYRLMKCKKYYSPFDAGGDNDFHKGCYYKVNLNNDIAEDSEGIMWRIDNISDYFTELNLCDKIICKLFNN